MIAEVGLKDHAHAYPPTLSGGENARAGLAVALANDPPVLLADEPTGEVDGGTAGQLIELQRGRAAAGSAVVVVTHNERSPQPRTASSGSWTARWRRELAHGATGEGARGNREVPPCAVRRLCRRTAGNTELAA